MYLLSPQGFEGVAVSNFVCFLWEFPLLSIFCVDKISRMYGFRTSFESCLRCRGKDIFTDVSRGDVICRDCGEVQASRIIDESSEYRIYANDDKGLGTSVMRSSGLGKETVWSNQSVFVGGTALQRASLQKAQLMSESKAMLKAAAHVDEVTHLSSKLNLPPAITVSVLCLFVFVCLISFQTTLHLTNMIP